jgi:predicted component of type VI protein secretion system
MVLLCGITRLTSSATESFATESFATESFATESFASESFASESFADEHVVEPASSVTTVTEADWVEPVVSAAPAPAPAPEAASEKPARSLSGLVRRVRGAQLPDTGPARDDMAPIAAEPELVRSSLASLQAGVSEALRQRENEPVEFPGDQS